MTSFSRYSFVYRRSPTIPLNSYERFEIQELNFTSAVIYFTGRNPLKIEPSDFDNISESFDIEGVYRVLIGDHLFYRYEILAILGQGAYGTVVLCLDHKQHENVAIKISINFRRARINGFENESNILRHLHGKVKNNYRLLKIHGTFQFRMHSCIVFETLPMDLKQLLCSRSPSTVPENVAKVLMHSTLVSLLDLHQNRIIHGDLKPNNIMLLTEKYFNFVKLIDFGLSQLVDGSVRNRQAPSYQPPEMIFRQPCYLSLDMWSIGCILFELLVGRRLFQSVHEDHLPVQLCVTVGPPPPCLIRRWIKTSPSMLNHFTEEGLSKYFEEFPYCETLDPTDNIDSLYSIERQLLQSVPNLSRACIEFIRACLKWNPDERLSCYDALNHRWIRDKEVAQIDTEPIRKITLPSLKRSLSYPMLFLRKYPTYYKNSCKQLIPT